MKNSFNLAISPAGQHSISFEAKSIIFPTPDGYMGCMAYRQPMISNLSIGLIKICDISDKLFYYAITGGFFEMVDNEGTLICDSLIKPEDIIGIGDKKHKTLKIQSNENLGENEKIIIAKEILRKKLQTMNP